MLLTFSKLIWLVFVFFASMQCLHGQQPHTLASLSLQHYKRQKEAAEFIILCGAGIIGLMTIDTLFTKALDPQTQFNFVGLGAAMIYGGSWWRKNIKREALRLKKAPNIYLLGASNMVFVNQVK